MKAKETIRNYAFLLSILFCVNFANSQPYFSGYWWQTGKNSFQKQAIDLNKSAYETDKILHVGFNSDDTLENWVSFNRPFINKTDLDGLLSYQSGTCSSFYQFTYELYSGANVVNADIKSVTIGDNGNYYIVGNLWAYKSDKIYIAEVDYQCGDILNIIQLNPTLNSIVPTKIINYNGNLYCIGYGINPNGAGADYDMFMLKIDQALVSYSLRNYYNVTAFGINDENCYPFDIIGRYNTVTSAHELVVVGEINNIDAITAPIYNHPYAFFTVIDESSMNVSSFKFYPYNLISATEGTWTRCFTEIDNGGAKEYFIPIMIDNLITVKTISLLHVDDVGNIISYMTADNNRNVGNGKMYPTSINYVSNTRIIVTSMEFTNGYFSTTNNTLTNARTVNTMEFDWSRLIIRNAKHIIGPAGNNIYSYSSIYNVPLHQLFISGTYWDDSVSEYRIFQSNDDIGWNTDCYKEVTAVSEPVQGIIDVNMSLPTKNNLSATTPTLTTVKLRTENQKYHCYIAPSFKTGEFEKSKIDKNINVKKIIVFDLLGRTVFVSDDSKSFLSVEEINKQLIKVLPPNQVYTVMTLDYKGNNVSTYKYSYINR